MNMALQAQNDLIAKEKIVALGRRNQITLPNEFIPKGATQFKCKKKKDGTIILIPHTSIPISQLYFWTKRWQDGEKEASEDIQAGRLYHFNSAEEAVQFLRGSRKLKRK